MGKKPELFRSDRTQDFITRVSKGSLSSVQDIWSKFRKEINVNGHNASGETSLMIATMNNDRDMADFLLNTCQADPNQKHPIFQQTSYDMANEHGYDAVADLLRNSVQLRAR